MQSLLGFSGYGFALTRFLTNQNEKTLEAWLAATRKEGAVALKFAQICSARGDLIDRKFTQAIQDCVCSNAPRHDWGHTEARLQEFFKEHPRYSHLLEDVQEVALASGSVAQIHLAGRYAFKVVHPDLGLQLQRWRSMMQVVGAGLTATGFGAAAAGLDNVFRAVETQMDMQAEAAAMKLFAERDVPMMGASGRILVPKPFAATRDVLLMDRVLAPGLHDLAKSLSPAAYQTVKLAAFAVVALIMDAPRQSGGLMHCDLHPGNVGILVPDVDAVDPKTLRFVVYDFGLVTPWRQGSSDAVAAYMRGDLLKALVHVYGEENRAVATACLESVRRRRRDAGEKLDPPAVYGETVGVLLWKNVRMKGREPDHEYFEFLGALALNHYLPLRSVGELPEDAMAAVEERLSPTARGHCYYVSRSTALYAGLCDLGIEDNDSATLRNLVDAFCAAPDEALDAVEALAWPEDTPTNAQRLAAAFTKLRARARAGAIRR